MNPLLPYELELNQNWNDLPLPDENMAWLDMKRRLDKDEKRRFLPFWLTGCAGWGLLGILLLGLGWWILRPEKWFMSKQNTIQVNPVVEKKNGIQTDTGFDRLDTGTQVVSTFNDSILQTENEDKSNTKTANPTENRKEDRINTETVIPLRNRKINTVTTIEKNKNKSRSGIVPQKQKQRIKDQPAPDVKKNEITNNNPDVRQDKQLPDTAVKISAGIKPKTDPVNDLIKTIPVTDELQKKDSITTKPVDPVSQINKSKKDSIKNKSISFGAGLGLYQQLPIAGQKWSPYSSSGRKGSLADYIPSIYLRAIKPGKWFLQAEFRYGAPQQTKEIAFRQAIINDTGANPAYRKTTTNTLKKTFYHQLPLNFNYYVLPNWSVGAGLQWNKFYAAIAERETIYRNNLLQTDSLLAKFIQPLKKDSASEFRKSYWQAIVQTQYHWNRFMIGARYNFGLQPYINFTLPGGAPQQEKNSSFQVFLLFELWKSKEK
jgi:hypothetical protein